MPTLEQQLAEAIAAQNALTQAVASKQAQIDAKVAQKTAEMQALALSRTVLRVTPNQVGNVANGLLDGFICNSAFAITFDVVRTISTGVAWVNRDAMDREWLTAMGLTGAQDFFPNFNIVRLRWSGAQPTVSPHTFYLQIPSSSSVTCACYSKLISGDIYGHGFDGARLNEVRLTGQRYGRSPMGYVHTHPYVRTASGEILFALYAAVQGDIPLDAPSNWGFFMSSQATSSTDTI